MPKIIANDMVRASLRQHFFLFFFGHHFLSSKWHFMCFWKRKKKKRKENNNLALSKECLSLVWFVNGANACKVKMLKLLYGCAETHEKQQILFVVRTAYTHTHTHAHLEGNVCWLHNVVWFSFHIQCCNEFYTFYQWLCKWPQKKNRMKGIQY